jgi:vitamin B12 transporter
MVKIFFVPLVFLILLLSIAIYAQNKSDSLKTYELSDVVVTATKTSTPAYELASSFSIIDSAQIKNSHKTSIYQLLQTQTGVSISQQGAPGAFTQVYLRGADPSQTQVLIDGASMNMANDPSNTYDFADLPTDNIEKIEIIRGPQSTLYGSNALAGVINIITKKGNGKPKFFLSTEGGSYNTYKGALGFSGSLEKLNYSLSLSKFKTDGFSSADEKFGNTEKDGTENYNASARIGYDVNKNFNLNFFGRYTKANTDFDQTGGKFGDDPTYKYNLEEGVYRLEGNLKLFEGKWDQKIGVSFSRNLRKYKFDITPNNPAESHSNYDGKRIKFDWQNNFTLNKNNILTFGIESENELANSSYYYSSHVTTSSPLPNTFESVFPEKSARTTGVYLEDQLNIDKSFFASIGARYDHHEKFGSVLTFRIAPAYVFWSTRTKIKATYGTGFKAPSLFYLYDPAYGNPNLSPEKSKGWDAGIEQYLFGYRVTAGLTYFQNTFTDRFGFDNNFKTINVNKSKTKGFEFYINTKLSNALILNANYTITESEDLSPGSADENLPLLRRPKHKAVISIDYNFTESFNAAVDAIFVGKREDKDFSTYPATRITIDSYTLLNASATYKVTGFLQIYGRLINILDSNYEEVYGYGTAKRSGYVGVKIGFE